jgi:hypothetical protein
MFFKKTIIPLEHVYYYQKMRFKSIEIPRATHGFVRLFPWLCLVSVCFRDCIFYWSKPRKLETYITVHEPDHLLRLRHRVVKSSSKLLLLFFPWSGEWLHCSREQLSHFPLFRSDWVGSGPELNALNRIRPSKIKKYIFLFLIVFY